MDEIQISDRATCHYCGAKPTRGYIQRFGASRLMCDNHLKNATMTTVPVVLMNYVCLCEKRYSHDCTCEGAPAINLVHAFNTARQKINGLSISLFKQIAQIKLDEPDKKIDHYLVIIHNRLEGIIYDLEETRKSVLGVF